MRHSRTPKAGKNTKSHSRIRVSADWSVIEKAVRSLDTFQDGPALTPIIPELEFCYIKTSLGVLQVDVGWLMMLIAHLVRDDSNVAKNGTPIEIELTESVVDAVIETIRSIPRYIRRDLLGMYFEAKFMIKGHDVHIPRLREIGIVKPYTFEKLCKLFFAGRDKGKYINLKLLGDAFATGELPLLSIPEMLEAFVRVISEQGPVGAKAWHKFIAQHFREKHGRGRRRDELYDNLFKRRTENPGLSYGVLAREVAKSKNIEFAVARDQVKAAMAYRRKRNIRAE